MTESIYFYPSEPKNGYSNPYCYNFKSILKKSFIVLDDEKKVCLMQGISLLKYSLKADIIFLNWLESIGYLKLGIVQFLLAIISIIIIKCRRKRIIWIYHNITPHQGNNRKSKMILYLLYKHSDLIITHSKEALNHILIKRTNNVFYKCHPVTEYPTIGSKNSTYNFFYDIVIWGSILPYKGIKEFISLREIQNSSYRIYILGKCYDEKLSNEIKSYCNNKIIFENRKANFEELNNIFKKTKYVLFPYIGNSISSSGAIIDTLALGGIPVAPHKGAFKDLKENNVCITYRTYDELLNILKSDIGLDENSIELFIKNNTWDSFGKFITNKINSL